MLVYFDLLVLKDLLAVLMNAQTTTCHENHTRT